MTSIRIEFNSDFIEFKVHPGIQGTTWLNHAEGVMKRDVKIRTVIHPGSLPLDRNASSITWDKIKNNIKIIEEEFKITWPEPVPDKFPFEQQILNRYHRYFAQATMFFNRWQIDLDYTFPTIPLDKQERFTQLLEEINSWIHIIERYCLSENGRLYQNQIKKLFLSLGTLRWRGEPEDQHLPHGTDPAYNVCLSMEVHGKNYLQAFLDGDDPDQIDVHGHRGMYGCLDIYADNTVFELLESKRFKDWLGSKNIRDYGLLQIGKVTRSSRPLQDLFSPLELSTDCKITILYE